MKQEDKRKRVFDISDKTAIAKLSGIQLSILQMEKASVELSKFIPEKKGVCTACTILCQRLMEDCPPINSKVQAGQMTPEEAKIRINQIKLNAEVIKEIGNLNKTDIIALSAKVEDRITTANNLADIYYDYALKYETQERLVKEKEEKEKKEEEVGEQEKKEKLKKILKESKEKKAIEKKTRAKRKNVTDPKYLKKTYKKKGKKIELKESEKEKPIEVGQGEEKKAEMEVDDKKIFGPLKTTKETNEDS